MVALFSSFGQTWFIALSGGHIRDAFGLSHGDFGMIYSAGTLASAAMLIWAGHKIDHIDLRAYTAVVCLGLAAACISIRMWAAPYGWSGSSLPCGLRVRDS